MDPDRVKAYLQAACAGLGFDVGEVWWTTGESGAPSVSVTGRFNFVLLPVCWREAGAEIGAFVPLRQILHVSEVLIGSFPVTTTFRLVFCSFLVRFSLCACNLMY